MSKDAQIAKLKRQIADAEAALAALREQLARLESGQTIQQAADAGDTVLALWKAALRRARERSSREQCRKAWSRIPKAERPDQDTALAALRAWNKSEEWTKDACMYAPGLHKWIDRRGWQDLPEGGADPLAKYRKPERPQAPAPEPAGEDEIGEFFAALKARGLASATPLQPAGKPGEICQIPAETGDQGTISLTSYLLEDRPVTP